MPATGASLLGAGDTVELTLRFASGATATLAAPVEPFTGQDEHSSTDTGGGHGQ